MKIDWRKRVFVVTWLAWCYLVVGCQTAESTTLKPILSPVATSSLVPAKHTSIPVLLPTPTSETVLIASSTSSPWKTDNFGGFLLYGANNGIYLFQPGNESTFIADGYLLEGQPWSPNGAEFVFNSDLTYRRDPHNQLTVANLSTGQTGLINLLAQPEIVFWSPNGKYLLYEVPVTELIEGASYVDTKLQARIALYDFASQQNILLTETSNILRLAGWSPDSQRIAFISTINDQDAQIENDLYTFGQFDLSILYIESLALQQITNSPDIELLAAWSPTDELLLFGATPINDS